MWRAILRSPRPTCGVVDPNDLLLSPVPGTLYTATISCADPTGNSASKTVNIPVPTIVTITSATPDCGPNKIRPLRSPAAGFGVQAPYTGDLPFILFSDVTQGWSAGCQGQPCGQDTISLVVTSWTDTQIVLGGFAGAYGLGSYTIQPGDQFNIQVWNAPTGSGPASIAITAPPVITSVSAFSLAQNETITINGSGFGARVSVYRQLPLYQAHGCELRRLDCGLLRQPRMPGRRPCHPGRDFVERHADRAGRVRRQLHSIPRLGCPWLLFDQSRRPDIDSVWNAQTGSGPATYNVTAPTPVITSVSPISTAQNQLITISGSGFGSHAPYTGDSAFIRLTDVSLQRLDCGLSRRHRMPRRRPCHPGGEFVERYADRTGRVLRQLHPIPGHGEPWLLFDQSRRSNEDYPVERFERVRARLHHNSRNRHRNHHSDQPGGFAVQRGWRSRANGPARAKPFAGQPHHLGCGDAGGLAGTQYIYSSWGDDPRQPTA